MKLLMTGDIHIGRTSSRIPGDPVMMGALRTTAAWDRIVGIAVREKVDVVLLSGDIADQDNKFWEAIGPLERGVETLAESKIRTVAVSGNHDFDVLPRLADQLPPQHFTLLGRNGNWERLTLPHNDQPALHIDGWSFPSERVQTSPLDHYNLPADATIPTLGMVHGDLDAPSSRYAPLSLSALQSKQIDGWLLGHVHAPRCVGGRPWVLYPGSPQAMDPGERGLHGVWITTLSDGRLATPHPIGVSNVWYDTLEIDLNDTHDEAAVEAHLLDVIRRRAEQVVDTAGADLRHVNLRLVLHGETPVADRVESIAEDVRADLDLTVSHAAVTVEKTDVQVTPPVDWHAFAKTSNAAGAIARLLLALDEPSPNPPTAQLIREVHEVIQTVARGKSYVQLESPENTDTSAVEYLRTQCRRLFTQLIQQQP